MFGGVRGGIHPPENKRATSGAAFNNLAVPGTAYISMQQHIGAVAEPVVSVGDFVEEGQIVGAGKGFISSNIHASVPGKVVDIGIYPGIYGKSRTVVIEAGGSFQSSSGSAPLRDLKSISIPEIVDLIKEAGIVGLGGAAFPAHVKLMPPAERKINTLVINGSECEPYLTVDDMLMRTYPREILEGIAVLKKALKVSNAVIGVEDNKPEAIQALKRASAGFSGVTVRSLKTRYPQGAEKQLIRSLLGREVPSKGLPMDVGAAVFNVGTAFAARDAVFYSRPLTSRYITVSGGCIAKPGNYKVRIGTRVSDIISECGGLTSDPSRVIFGGPMCGTAINTMDIPVVKGTSGILFMSARETDNRAYGPCLRCGKCVSACPSGLLPCEIANAAEASRYDIAAGLSPNDCIACGSCSYVCPSKRPVSHFIKMAQAEIKRQKGM